MNARPGTVGTKYYDYTSGEGCLHKGVRYGRKTLASGGGRGVSGREGGSVTPLSPQRGALSLLPRSQKGSLGGGGKENGGGGIEIASRKHLEQRHRHRK